MTFLAVLAVYLYACVDVRLVFWNQNDLFLWNYQFVRAYLASPGGPCDWVGKLLLQACCLGWPGAIVATFVAGVLLFSARSYFRRLGPDGAIRHVWLVPAVLLVVLLSQYTISLSAIVGLALAMVGSSFYASLPGRLGWPRLPVFIAASLVIDYAAGSAYYVFAACCLLFELWSARRRWLAALLLLTIPAVAFGVDHALPHLIPVSVYAEVPEASYLVACGAVELRILGVLYAYYPVCALYLTARRSVAGLFGRLRRAPAASKAPGKWSCTVLGVCHCLTAAAKTLSDRRNRVPAAVKQCHTAGAGPQNRATLFSTEPAASNWGDAPPAETKAADARGTNRYAGVRRIVRWTAVPLLFVSATAATMKWSAARSTKAVLAIDYHANRGDWNEVLAAARRLPDGVRAEDVSYDINLALYHTGRLSHDMFSYPQANLLVDHDFGNRGRLLARKAFDLLLALGRVNEAETVAHDDLERHLSAETIRRAVLVKRIKGQAGAARIYLNVLRDDVTYGRWASGQLDRLDGGEDAAGPEIADARRRMIVKDDAYLTHGGADGRSVRLSRMRQLVSLLEHDSKNRMAFEYSMTTHMMSRDLDAFVSLLPRAAELWEGRLPPLYEEAAMLYGGSHRDKVAMSAGGAAVCGFPVGNATLKRFQRLLAIDRSCRGLDNAKSRDAVLRELGPTYFFYYFFGPKGPQ